MVHIYHLHANADISMQCEAIVTCMDALESVSRIWLVGKMVHDLFEAILTLDGFDRYLKGSNSHRRHTKLSQTGSAGSERDSYEEDLEASQKAIKALSLTPSLIAHMDAALKSAALPNKPATNGISNGTHRQVPNARPLAPRVWDSPQTFYPEETYPRIPSTPGPTGLNAVEWSVALMPVFCTRLLTTGTLGSNSLVFNEELYKRRSLPLKYSPYICGCLLTHLEFGGAPDRAIGWLSCSVVALLVRVVYERHPFIPC
jgi:hypothetical protein